MYFSAERLKAKYTNGLLSSKKLANAVSLLSRIYAEEARPYERITGDSGSHSKENQDIEEGKNLHAKANECGGSIGRPCYNSSEYKAELA